MSVALKDNSMSSEITAELRHRTILRCLKKFVKGRVECKGEVF